MGTEPQRAAGTAAETAGGDGAQCAQETGGGGEGEGVSISGKEGRFANSKAARTSIARDRMGGFLARKFILQRSWKKQCYESST